MTAVTATKGGWTRAGSRRHFYLDARGRRITDPGKLERIEALAIPLVEGRSEHIVRPCHLRVVRARETGLDLEEEALVSLLRSWRIRSARKAA